MNGWIKLNKRIRKHWLWDHPEYFRAWVDMLMMANWEQRKSLHKTELVAINRGEFPAAYRKLATRWDWSIGKVKRFIELLKSDTMIDTHTDYGFTVVKIINFDKFQHVPRNAGGYANRHTDRHTDGHTDGTQTGTTIRYNKNIKEIKDIKEKQEKESSPVYLKVWKKVHSRFGLQESQWNGYTHLIMEAIGRIGFDNVMKCSDKFLQDKDSQIRSIRYYFQEGIDRYLVDQVSTKPQFKKLPSGLFKAFCLKCGKKNMPNEYQLKQNSSCCGVEYVAEQPKITNTSKQDAKIMKEIGYGA